MDYFFIFNLIGRNKEQKYLNIPNYLYFCPPDGATVLDLLHAHRVSPFELCSSRLALFAMGIRFAPSVRQLFLLTKRS